MWSLVESEASKNGRQLEWHCTDGPSPEVATDVPDSHEEPHGHLPCKELLTILRIQRLLLSVHRGNLVFFQTWLQDLLQFSPLSFADSALEGAFRAVQHANGFASGIVSLSMLTIGTIIACTVSDVDSSDELLLLVFIAFNLVTLLLSISYPKSISEYTQAINGVERVAIIISGLHVQSFLVQPGAYGPLSPVIFLQKYMFFPLVIASTLAKSGAWQAFMPGLATSTVMLFIQVSGNQQYCTALGPVTALDSVPLSVVPKALDVLSAAIVYQALPPWHLSSGLSCSRSITAVQLVGSFITDIGVLVSEAVQRRTFLMKNAARLGPNGLERAASWPLGDIRGVQRCIMVAVSHVAGLCLFWQLLNLLV
eukprot:jgi/Botrbrau1/2114/Bobra.0093s0021.1